jgi:hypothetical protein
MAPRAEDAQASRISAVNAATGKITAREPLDAWNKATPLNPDRSIAGGKAGSTPRDKRAAALRRDYRSKLLAALVRIGGDAG